MELSPYPRVTTVPSEIYPYIIFPNLRTNLTPISVIFYYRDVGGWVGVGAVR